MEFSAWSVFTDLGLMSLLLLLGFLLRAKVRIIQELFLLASLIAGLLGLILGPNGLNIMPFSGSIGSYAGILITLVFGALPLSAAKVPFKSITKRVGNMWAYGQMTSIFQWGFGALFGLVVIGSLWHQVNPGFGLILAAGFSGGHGTAAAIGTAFAGLGWEEASSLAMTAATVGVVSAIVGGLIIIKWGAKKGYTSIITDFADLPEELKTGLVPKEKREESGKNTISSIALDPQLLHLGLIATISVAGYYLAVYGSQIIPKVQIPPFSVAFILGTIAVYFFDKAGVSEYVDKKVVTRISGTSTDLLVAFGIASIKLPVVIAYAGPLALLFAFGLLQCWLMFRFLGPRMFEAYWFERSIFTWGWATGTMAMGIALLRIVDPNLESKTLDDFALSFIPSAPVDIIVVSSAPLMFASGQGWPFIGATIGFGAAIFIFAYMKGWIKTSQINIATEKS